MAIITKPFAADKLAHHVQKIIRTKACPAFEINRDPLARPLAACRFRSLYEHLRVAAATKMVISSFFQNTFGNITRIPRLSLRKCGAKAEVSSMNGLIYLIGLIVVIMAILSFLGLR
jgi:hypothetical protein